MIEREFAEHDLHLPAEVIHPSFEVRPMAFASSLCQHMFEAIADWHDSEQNRSSPTLQA